MFLSNPVKPANLTDRLLARATYGATPMVRSHLEQNGLDNWLDKQLLPQVNQESEKLKSTALYHQPIASLATIETSLIKATLQTKTILQAVGSEYQLHEVLTEFWSDHFNISFQSRGRIMPFLKLIDDRDHIRPHTLGKFLELLTASAHSPAMLLYLSNVRNVVASPNENYARELLELHTVGIDGGYTHEDIDEVARILTGWGVVLNQKKSNFGLVHWSKKQHDNDRKTVLGQPFELGAVEDLESLLTLLANHPATANRIAMKLAQRFVSDDPPATLVLKVAAVYQKTEGDIAQMLRTIFTSREFANAPALLKRPFRFVVSACRLLEVEISEENNLNGWLTQMGQPLFSWPFPDGYPDDTLSWADKLLPRWNFALQLSRNQIKGVTIEWDKLVHGNFDERLDQLANRLFGSSLDEASNDLISQHLQDANLKHDSQQAWIHTVALLLSSPAFQWM